MKNLIAITILIFGFLTAQPVLAHDDHVHPLTEEQAVKAATAKLDQLIAHSSKVGGETLDENWQTQAGASVHKKGQGYYIIAFPNAKAEKTLYLLISSTGELYDANFSGTFNGVK